MNWTAITNCINIEWIYSGGSRGGGATGTIPPLKPAKVTLFAMILYNSENNIRDVGSFALPLFCQSSVVKNKPVL